MRLGMDPWIKSKGDENSQYSYFRLTYEPVKGGGNRRSVSKKITSLERRLETIKAPKTGPLACGV